MITRWHRWHRACGLAVALFASVIAGTGMALMFTDELGLPARFVSSEGLLDWYAVRPAPPPVAFAVGSNWVSQLGARVYFDQRELTDRATRLTGAVGTAAGIVVALDDELWLLDPAGAVIDRWSRLDGLPQPVDALGVAAAGVYVRSAGRSCRFEVDDGACVPAADVDPAWAVAGVPPAPLAASLAAAYRGRALSLERVILDLHTGRMFGRVGVAVVSLVAMLLVFLAFSGVFTWWLRRRRMRRGRAR